MKILLNKNIYFVLVFSALLLPHSVSASNVYIDTNHSDFFVGDTILLNVRINSENKNINAVEGLIILDSLTESVSLSGINTYGSKISLWTRKPLPSVDNASISFAGGILGGLNSNDAIVFNIVLKLQKAGQVTLIANDLSVYLHDGKGTKDKVNFKNLVINVLPKKINSQSVDDWGNFASNDNIPPEPFEIYLDQEESVFGGKKFLSFSAMDKQSGIAYYEVIEGDLPTVRNSSGTYILQEQNKAVKVIVVAYDPSGNFRESIYSSSTYSIKYIGIILSVLLVVVILIYKKIKKNGHI